jgi:hypothetical protein
MQSLWRKERQIEKGWKRGEVRREGKKKTKK